MAVQRQALRLQQSPHLTPAVIPCTPPGFIPWLSCQESPVEDRMNSCVKAFQERTQRYKEEQQTLNCSVANTRPLKPICSEDTVLWVLHEYAKKYHPLTLGTASLKQKISLSYSWTCERSQQATVQLERAPNEHSFCGGEGNPCGGDEDH